MKHINFEDFLKEWHMKAYHGTDDNAPDAYEKWVSELEVGNIIELADLTIHEGELRGMKHSSDIATAALSKYRVFRRSSGWI